MKWWVCLWLMGFGWGLMQAEEKNGENNLASPAIFAENDPIFDEIETLIFDLYLEKSFFASIATLPGFSSAYLTKTEETNPLTKYHQDPRYEASISVFEGHLKQSKTAEEKQLISKKLALLLQIHPNKTKRASAEPVFKVLLNTSAKHPDWQKVLLLYAIYQLEFFQVATATKVIKAHIAKFENSLYSDIAKVIYIDLNYRQNRLKQAVHWLKVILDRQLPNNIHAISLLRIGLVYLKKQLFQESLQSVKQSLGFLSQEGAKKNRIIKQVEVFLTTLLLRSKDERIYAAIKDGPLAPFLVEALFIRNLFRCKRGDEGCQKAFESFFVEYPFHENMPLYRLQFSKFLRTVDRAAYFQQLEKIAISYNPKSVWSQKNADFSKLEFVHGQAWESGLASADYFYHHGSRTGNVKSYYMASTFYQGLLDNFSATYLATPAGKKISLNFVKSLLFAEKLQEAFTVSGDFLKGSQVAERHQLLVLHANAAKKLFESMSPDALPEKNEATGEETKSSEKITKKIEGFLAAVDQLNKEFPLSDALPQFNLDASFASLNVQDYKRARDYLKQNLTKKVHTSILKRSIRQIIASYIQEKNIEEVFGWTGTFLKDPMILETGMKDELLNIHVTALFQIVANLGQAPDDAQKRHQKMVLLLDFGQAFPKHPRAKQALLEVAQTAFKEKRYEMVVKTVVNFQRNYKPTLPLSKMLALSYEKLCLFKKSAKTFERIYYTFSDLKERLKALKRAYLLRKELNEPLATASLAEKLAQNLRAGVRRIDYLIEAANIYLKEQYYFKAVVLYASALKLKPKQELRLKALIGKYLSYVGLNKESRAHQVYKELLQDVGGLPKYDLIKNGLLGEIVAQVYLLGGDRWKAKMEKNKLTLKKRSILFQLRDQEARLKKSVELYTKSISIGNKHFITLAKHRIVDVYDLMQKSASQALNVQGLVPEKYVFEYREKIKQYYQASLDHFEIDQMLGKQDGIMNNIHLTKHYEPKLEFNKLIEGMSIRENQYIFVK